MAKFILKFNNEVVDHIEITQGDMKIGRKPGSEIILDNLAVSGTHANIFTIGDDSFVQDLGSTNGTFVNHKKVAKHHLHNGDVVTIGKHSLIFVNEVTAQQNTEDFAKTVVINPGSMSASGGDAPNLNLSETVETRLPPIKRGGRTGAIFVLSGANSGKRIELKRSITSLGKVGKRSGIIKKTDSGYRIEVPSDAIGTPTLNGKPVPPTGTDLKNGDIIEISGARLQFYLK